MSILPRPLSARDDGLDGKHRRFEVEALGGHACRQINLGSTASSRDTQVRDRFATAAFGREVVTFSGDFDVGCNFNINAMRRPSHTGSLTSVGVSRWTTTQPLVGNFADAEFSPAFGIGSTLRDELNQFNFGIVQGQPTGRGPGISALLTHADNGYAVHTLSCRAFRLSATTGAV